jgi:UDP-glucuronate decarboxylase
MNFAQKNIIVAGGAGFIGTHLVAALLAQGAQVTVLDNFSTGKREKLEQHPSLKVLCHDVCEPFHSGQVDVIFNLACPASPVHYQADPIATWRTSVYGADRLLTLAAAQGARFVQASTSEIYGDPEVAPQSESYRGNTSTLGPRACYDEGKRAAESLAMDFYRVQGVDVRLARIFNTYGPGMAQDDGRAVSNFVVQALQGLPLTIYGDGTQTRSFCFVSDTVRGLMALAATEALAGRVVNLGNPHEITIKTLTQTIASLAGRPCRQVRKPLPEDDPRRRCPDISRALALLNWSPEVTLEDGLAITVADFRARLTAPETAMLMA